MVVFDIEREVNDISAGESASGKLSKQDNEDKLMNSVLAGDKQTIEHAELIQEANNRGVGAFTPDMMFSHLVNNFQMTKQLYGDKLIKMLTGYDPNYIERNLKIPEFNKELRNALNQAVKTLKDKELLDEEGKITPKGIELSTLSLVQELDNFITKESMGEKTNKHARHYGEKGLVRDHRKGDRYKDINLKRSVHTAIRRGHKKLERADLKTSERTGKGRVSLIIALDSSASMKGRKLDTCKRAGAALAYKAIQEKDDVGLVVFGSEIKAALPPTRELPAILETISSIRASKQTDFAAMITKAAELFPLSNETKHLIILTDAMPTVGKEPERETLKAVSTARYAGITTSLIGIQLDKEGSKLAERITQLGEGRLSLVKNLDEVGTLVLEDYYAVR